MEASAPAPFDVVVCGGGLSGLTFALRLLGESPGARVAVIDRVSRPLPEACHKVGESSVEVASHFFAELIGLSDYLDESHLHKNGLRFFTGDSQRPLHERPEVGPPEFPIVPSFQLDRGRLENDLRARVEAAGATLLEGRVVRSITLDDGGHSVELDDRTLEARWVVDASGRRRLLSKQLDLRLPSPAKASAAWFRLDGRIKARDLVPESERQWHQRDIEDNRWLSTNHFVGRGYWVWLIPLATGYSSIGIVADHEHHDPRSFNKPERARAWLAEHEPLLAAHIEGRGFEDFRVMNDYSYLTKQMISPDRWACIGEASSFVDPLYSLGGDFLAMSCCYTARAIADDLAGRHDPEVIEELDAIYLLLVNDSSRTLSRNGKIFPHGKLLGAKLWWDFFNYWSFMCAHFFQRVWQQDAATLRRFRELGQQFYDLNTTAQRLLEGWAALKDERCSDGQKRFVALPLTRSILSDAHVALAERRDIDETFAKMEADLELGRELVAEVFAHALRDLGREKAATLGAALGAAIGGEEPEPRGAGMKLPLGERFTVVDELPRRERLGRYSKVARDLERALGRQDGDAPLSELLDSALTGAGVMPVRAARPDGATAAVSSSAG